jgi:hypothetical protein
LGLSLLCQDVAKELDARLDAISNAVKGGARN